MNYLVAQIAILFIKLFKWVPFSFLQLKASFVAWFLGSILSYRKKVVEANLKRCFPNKSLSELTRIKKAFYLNIADILLESLKGLTLSQANTERRFKVLNPEVLNQFYHKNQSVMCLAAHYGNWEWGIQAVNSQIEHQAISIYKPLANPYLERYMHRQRSRLGMQLYPMEQTKEAFAKAAKMPMAIILAADQSPSDTLKSVIVDFFDERLGFIHGPEAYYSKSLIPVVYFDVQRVKRGYYTLEIKVLTEGGTPLAKNELTQRYANSIETILKIKPENWLWSHKRWKHSYSHHPDYIKSKL
jgi:KDO2-lipid IV(A) lauroyltransferase